jgi:3-dehydroquinate synthase
MDITIRCADGSLSRVLFGPLASLPGLVDPAKSVVVTDPTINRIYGVSFPSCPVVEVPRGEAAKSLAELESLYGRFLELGLGRDATVVAIGGGTVSDLAGFAASTWQRGVDFGFAPTTLLAMVDASVGGKNGVDFRGLKNQVGTFRQPRFVLMDVGLLRTLPDIEFQSGMAEAVKHAVLAGGEYFELVASARPRRAADASNEVLERIVEGSARLKALVVGRDEREGGERRKLNLGHTVGHAIEAATGLPHGHSVAAGLGTVCRLSRRLGRMKVAEADRAVGLISACGLPSSIAEAALLAAELGRAPGDGSPAVRQDGPDLRARIAAALTADKKRLGSDILVALPLGIGDVGIESIPVRELADFVMEAP